MQDTMAHINNGSYAFLKIRGFGEREKKITPSAQKGDVVNKPLRREECFIYKLITLEQQGLNEEEDI